MLLSSSDVCKWCPKQSSSCPHTWLRSLLWRIRCRQPCQDWWLISLLVAHFWRGKDGKLQHYWCIRSSHRRFLREHYTVMKAPNGWKRRLESVLILQQHCLLPMDLALFSSRQVPLSCRVVWLFPQQLPLVTDCHQRVVRAKSASLLANEVPLFWSYIQPLRSESWQSLHSVAAYWIRLWGWSWRVFLVKRPLQTPVRWGYRPCLLLFLVVWMIVQRLSDCSQSTAVGVYIWGNSCLSCTYNVALIDIIVI